MLGLRAPTPLPPPKEARPGVQSADAYVGASAAAAAVDEGGLSYEATTHKQGRRTTQQQLASTTTTGSSTEGLQAEMKEGAREWTPRKIYYSQNICSNSLDFCCVLSFI